MFMLMLFCILGLVATCAMIEKQEFQ